MVVLFKKIGNQLFYKKFFLMQLFDRNVVFKDWNSLKQEHNLLNILYFQRMQLISSIPSGKILNKITISILLRQPSIVLFKTQEYLRFKI